MSSDVDIQNGKHKTSFVSKNTGMDNRYINKSEHYEVSLICISLSYINDFPTTRPQEISAGKLINLHSYDLKPNLMSYKPLHLDPSKLKYYYERGENVLNIFTPISRIPTFSNWKCKKQYPRFLADAGFYFRGRKSIVHCFECGLETDVEKWFDGENPNQAHARLNKDCQYVKDNNFKLMPTIGIESKKNISTEEIFLKSKNNNIDEPRPEKKEIEADNSSMQNSPVNATNSQFPSNLSALDTTDAMNNQITDPSFNCENIKYKDFADLQSRILTFTKWEYESKQRASFLAEAGFFYTGENDIVRCFCCDLGLAEWDPKDDPWTEHARHSPTCRFLLHMKRDQFVQEIQREWKRIYNPKHAALDDKKSRKSTFIGWREDIEQTPDILADAGFFFTGDEDIVRCHYCDGGLRNWEPGDDPWEEHTRWFPFCKFVIKMKGREYIEEIKRLTVRRQLEEDASRRTSEAREISYKHVKDQLKELSIPSKDINYAFDQFSKQQDVKEFTVEWAMQIIYDVNGQFKTNPFSVYHNTEDKPVEKDPQKLLETNKKLKEQLKCMRCKANDACMLFVNCGHRVTCESCAEKMDFCLYCNKKVKQRMKTFLS